MRADEGHSSLVGCDAVKGPGARGGRSDVGCANPEEEPPPRHVFWGAWYSTERSGGRVGLDQTRKTRLPLQPLRGKGDASGDTWVRGRACRREEVGTASLSVRGDHGSVSRPKDSALRRPNGNRSCLTLCLLASAVSTDVCVDHTYLSLKI